MTAAKDFDSERRIRNAAREEALGDRTVILGGKPFKYRATVSYTVLEAIAATGELEGAELIRGLESAVVRLLEDGQEEAFLDVVRSLDDPWTFADLNDLATWLTEAQVGRPLPLPSPSTAGGEETGTSSTDDSSSRQAAA